MQINLQQTRYYHVVSRCVRRAFLCGVDHLTGKNFDHRKGWLVARFKELSSIFSIQVAGYAAMSNHVHLVVYVDTDAAKGWSNDEVISRWGQLFPRGLAGLYAKGDPVALEKRAVLDAQVSTWRSRLVDLSWYMKSLNEFIARRANAEDNCTGKYWEGRYRCQALLDDAAVLMAMSYVDLNPIRAGVAQTLERSDFTSVQERIEAHHAQSTSFERRESACALDTIPAAAPLMPFLPELNSALRDLPNLNDKDTERSPPTLPATFQQYLALVDWTGRQIQHGKRGSIPDNVEPILLRMGVDPSEWVTTLTRFNKRFQSVAGAVDRLEQWCKATGRRWLRGEKAAAKLYVQLA